MIYFCSKIDGQKCSSSKEKSQIIRYCNREDTAKMPSHQFPSMDAVDANVENPEDKFICKTECTSR